VYGGGVNYIKADIEGYETALLKGAGKTLKKAANLKMSLCTYHRQNDAEDLRTILEQYDFTTEYSNGYMLFVWDKYLSAPYLRRGMIRACKH
jgi:hypothetical protein